MSDAAIRRSAWTRRFSIGALASLLILAVACGAPVDDQTDSTSTTNQTEEPLMESTTTSNSDESGEESTESTQPQVPTPTTTKPVKKDGLPVPPDPTIPPPRD